MKIREKTPSRKKALIYVRVSSKKQTSVGDGLVSQETVCRAYAYAKGYEVIQTFADDMTGRSSKRPGMSDMLTYIRKHRADGMVVIIYDISRLARSLPAHLELRDLIDKAGGSLESPNASFNDDDPKSMMVERFQAVMADYFSSENRRQTIDRMSARVTNGYSVARAPVGYRYEAVAGCGKMLVPDEPVASVVREAFEGYATARFNRQADVMRFLQENPLFPKDSDGNVRNMRVTQMLSLCTYAGFVEAPRLGCATPHGQS